MRKVSDFFQFCYAIVSKIQSSNTLINVVLISYYSNIGKALATNYHSHRPRISIASGCLLNRVLPYCAGNISVQSAPWAEEKAFMLLTPSHPFGSQSFCYGSKAGVY